MLYFRTKPDPVFLAILHQALESELQEITRISAEKDFDAWEAGYGTVCEVFTPYSALVTIEQLLIESQKVIVYRLSEYHWLLIYECLKNYCAVHQDLASQEEDHCLTITEYRLREIDFQGMVDLYFWDTDFLFLSDQDPSERLSEHFSCIRTPNTADLTADLQPHPMHLQFVPVHDPMWSLPEPHEYFGDHSRHYPDFS